MAGELEISKVPPDEGMGIMPSGLFNPTDKDFTFKWDGVPYIVPAGEIIQFPEWLSRHGAKHLAQKICQAETELKVKKEAKEQKVPDIDKAVPDREIQDMMKALLIGPNAFEGLKPKEVEEVIEEEPKAEEQPIAEEKKGMTQKKLDALARGRATLRAKQIIAKREKK